eukprot:jgi/Bigna1/88152/estExt_fgenesh1_pg.C_280183
MSSMPRAPTIGGRKDSSLPTLDPAPLKLARSVNNTPSLKLPEVKSFKVFQRSSAQQHLKSRRLEPDIPKDYNLKDTSASLSLNSGVVDSSRSSLVNEKKDSSDFKSRIRKTGSSLTILSFMRKRTFNYASTHKSIDRHAHHRQAHNKKARRSLTMASPQALLSYPPDVTPTVDFSAPIDASIKSSSLDLSRRSEDISLSDISL